jgi:predicted branched-subunit amino acid permease
METIIKIMFFGLSFCLAYIVYIIYNKILTSHIDEIERDREKEPIQKRWWFVGLVSPLLFVLIYIMGTTTILIFTENNPQRELIGLVFILLSQFVFSALMILKARSLNKEVIGNIFWVTLVLSFFVPELLGLLPVIFGIAWIIKAIKHKNANKKKGGIKKSETSDYEKNNILYCTQCGNELEKDSKFCHKCGVKI